MNKKRPMGESHSPGSARYGLVLSGGGIRFATHAGVIAEMSRWHDQGQPWLDKFHVLVGTSAGALYSAMLAVGYTPAHVARFAALFGKPKLKQALFHWNYYKAAASFLRHDISYFLGLTSGFGVLTLVETFLAKGMPEQLMALYPDPEVENASALDAVERAISEAWRKRRDRRRDRQYYADLLTFSDCKKELYLIGVNAYTGQKVAFGKLPLPSQWDRLDRQLYAASKLNYINEKHWRAELKELEEKLNLPYPLKYRRFENRVYHDFDTALFPGTEATGPQLPIALAVRASVSMPVFFEPTWIQRAYQVPHSARHEEDLFLDGGVDDNFSLSVAADKNLGRCTHIFGVSLGNWGFRFPDVNAARNIGAVLLNTTNYFGNAIQDLQERHKVIVTRRVTILNALPSIGAQLTDTEKIGDLVKEGREMAQEFWSEAHQKKQYPDGESVPVDPKMIFGRVAGLRVYVSRTARLGTDAFRALKTGQAILPNPGFFDVFTQVPRVFIQAFTDLQARAWFAGYGVLALVLFGSLTLLSDLLGEPTGLSGAIRKYFFDTDAVGWSWLALRVGVVLIFVLGLRFWAFVIWTRIYAKRFVRS